MRERDYPLAVEQALGDFLEGRAEKMALTRALREVAPDEDLMGRFIDVAFQVVQDRVERGAPPVVILGWLRRFLEAALVARTDHSKTVVESYFGRACREKLRRVLPTTRKTLDICVYTITDNEVVSAILAAKRTRVKVRIITDFEKIDAKGSDIRYLERNGVFVKVNTGQEFMHHKFAIFDRTSLVTGSYNWTVGAATENYENLIYTDSPDAVRAFQREFDSLWKSCAWLTKG